tara:strand:- start:24579 stop:24788 length:210 start_codon:yes stop_codon:yes gene_type:complete
MFVRFVILPAALVARIAAQSSPFEPPDFNVTAALENLRVDVSALPEPGDSTIAERSGLQACVLAVGVLR